MATDALVVGAGPAGLAAAAAAAEAGLHVTLVDELPWAGGQYLAGSSGSGPVSAAERRGYELLDRLPASGVDWQPGTLVWNLNARLEADVYSHSRCRRLSCGSVILAGGARESIVPFPGWTLPGVLTAGAAQLLAKRHRLAPGRRVVFAGSGPLLLPVAAKVAEMGSQVVAVLEASHPVSWLKWAAAIWGNWDRLIEAGRYLTALRKAGIPYRTGQAVTTALGEERVEGVVIAKLDRSGRPQAGSGVTIAADTLAVGFGLRPNVELLQLAGARLLFDPGRGGWVPMVDDTMQTTVPGMFAAGEATGVAGAAVGMAEGRIAGLAAAHKLGRVSEAVLSRERATLAGARTRAQRFATMMNTVFAPPPGLQAIITDETLICRCEEVSAGEARAAIRAGAQTLDALKTRLRVGQGPCQGRTCGTILARLLAAQTGATEEGAGQFHVRPPVKPLPLGALAETSLS